MARALSLSDYRALAEFRYQIRAFLSFSERAARGHGIEPQQHQLLLACKGLPASDRPTVGTLARRLCVEHHTAVSLVDKLAAAGLVQRAASPVDRREVLVQITERGETLLAALSELHRDQLMEVGPKLIQALSSVLADRVRALRER
ncbi:MAG: MarR family transcriptional regulator [Polyangiales bacterium]